MTSALQSAHTYQGRPTHINMSDIANVTESLQANEIPPWAASANREISTHASHAIIFGCSSDAARQNVAAVDQRVLSRFVSWLSVFASEARLFFH